MIQLAIFDLGKVLIDFDFTVAIQRIRKVQPLDLFKVKSLFQNSTLPAGGTRVLSRTGILLAGLARAQADDHSGRVPRHLERDFHGKARDDRACWTVPATRQDRGYFQYKSLARGIHPPHVRINSFDHFIASCDVHLLKPDPRIFQLLSKRPASTRKTLYISTILRKMCGRARTRHQLFSFHRIQKSRKGT